MYSRRELSQQKEAFWTTFGRYMSPIPSASGEHINWVNYKTGIKDVRITMDVHCGTAIVSIVFSHKDERLRIRFYEHLHQLKHMFETTVGDNWLWEKEHISDDGRISSTVFKQLQNVNFVRKEDWPNLIGFFKENLILLDDFWETVKDSFESIV